MIDLQHGDSLQVLQDFPDSYFSAVVTDPPYGLSSTPDMAEVLRHWLAGDDYQHRGGGFMGKSWDSFVPGPKLWAEVLRVMRPGAHLLCFAGSRTQDLMTVALRLAGFEVRDTIMWVYGTGFPKSMAIDKAIDKMRFDRPEVLEVTAWVAAARDAAGLKNSQIDAAFGFCGMAGHWTSQKSQPTVPTLEQVPLLLQTLGDPVVPDRIRQLLFELNGRKGTPGADWLKREVVGEVEMADTTKVKNACSLASQGLTSAPTRIVQLTAPTAERSKPWLGYGTTLKPAFEPVVVAMRPTEGRFAQNALSHGVAGFNIDACRTPEGRWPANVAHDGSEEVLDCFPDAPGQQGDLKETGRPRPSKGRLGDMAPPRAHSAREDSTKSASRFFYCAKPTTSERDEGLGERGNVHPTVKPVELMRWLVRMVKYPAENRVLDPFMGSGTTGVACRREGVDFVGVEQNAEYLEVARGRINAEPS